MITECPKCGFTMTVDEYGSLERCPQCGKSFAGIAYTAAIILGAIVAAGAWLIHWKASTRVSLVGAVVATCFGLGFAGLTVAIDQLLLRTTNLSKHSRRTLGGWLTVGILLVVAFLTKDYVVSLAER